MKNNLILQAFAYEAYRNRLTLPSQSRVNYRIERVNNGLLCDLWFLTTGCRHDAQGGCVMCNYGKGPLKIRPKDEKLILDALKKMVRELPWTFEDFLLTSSGSLLDPGEVSPEMWEKLIPILENVRAQRFIIETRAETVTDLGLSYLERVKAGAQKYVEIGLESSNDWVLEHCINKSSTFEMFRCAVRKAHHHGIFVTANVGLGIPFMSERAAIREAIRSVRDALSAGADSVVILPYHVKNGTLLDVMHQNGLYHCVSLWALVEVLNHFPQEHDRLQISWYKDYFGPERSFIHTSPQTCPNCTANVLDELDRYRNDPNMVSIERLHSYSCACHDAWHQTIETQSTDINIEDVERSYRCLATIFPVDQELLELEISRMRKECEELRSESIQKWLGCE